MFYVYRYHSHCCSFVVVVAAAAVVAVVVAAVVSYCSEKIIDLIHALHSILLLLVSCFVWAQVSNGEIIHWTISILSSTYYSTK